MKHDEIVAEVQRRAAVRRVLSHYCGRSVYCSGDRGLPDLIVVGLNAGAFIEVKTASDTLDTDQRAWWHMLIAAGFEHYVIGPEHLADGTVDAILEVCATGTIRAIPTGG